MAHKLEVPIAVYNPTPQALNEDAQFNYVAQLDDTLQFINTEAIKWFTDSSSLLSSTICGFSKRSIKSPINVKNIIALKSYGAFEQGAVVYAHFNDMLIESYQSLSKTGTVVGSKYVAEHTTGISTIESNKTKQASTIASRAFNTENDFRDFVCDWAKFQVLKNANDAPKHVNLVHVMSDMYADKGTYRMAVQNEGLLVLELPEQMATNKQTSSVLFDICTARSGRHPTLLISRGIKPFFVPLSKSDIKDLKVKHKYSSSSLPPYLAEADSMNVLVDPILLNDAHKYKQYYRSEKMAIRHKAMLNDLRRAVLCDGLIESYIDRSDS